MAGIDSDLIRGHIDTIILKSLFEGDKYGLEIIQEIEEKSNGSYELKQPTLYSCLKRLENQGLISSYWEDSEIGGKRHYYTLTNLGKEEYQNNQKEWLRSKEIIDNLIYDDSANQQDKELPIIDQLDNLDDIESNEQSSAPLAQNETDTDIKENNFATNIDEHINSMNTNDQELNSVDDSDNLAEVVDNCDIEGENQIDTDDHKADADNNDVVDNCDIEGENQIDTFEFDTLEVSEQDNNNDNSEYENMLDENNFDNTLAEQSNDFQFANFDEIENTAFGTFFEANSEVASSDELMDEFDEPITSNSDAQPIVLEENVAGEDETQDDVQGDGDSSQEYVSLIDFLAQSADDNNNENSAKNDTLLENENVSEVDEISTGEQLENESIMDNETIESEEIISEDEIAENSQSDDEVDNDGENILEIDEISTDNEVVNDNETTTDDEQLETINFEDDIEDYSAEMQTEENIETSTLSGDNAMILGDEINDENNLAVCDNDEVHLNEDDIYSLAGDDEQDSSNNFDDEIYSPIPEDEQIYIPQNDDEETFENLDDETSVNNQNLSDDEKSSDDSDSLYLFNDEVNDSSDQASEVVAPTYINFGTHTYDEADITKDKEEFDLYNLADDTGSNSDQNELDSMNNLAEDDASQDNESEPVESMPTYEEPQPIYRASQEEIESLYKTTENYENLQAGYTDETYKQMLNELENYGSTTEEQTTQRPVAKSFEELSANLEKEGIKIRKFEKQQKESDDTKIYIKTHQIHMVKNWITFGISAFALILTFLIMNAFKENFTYPFSFAPFAIAIGVSALFPLYSTILYLSNPYKKVVAKYAPRLTILLSIMINIQLILIIYCLNLQLGFYSFAQENYNHLMWILPLILSFIPTIQSIVYYPLYNSKNYHT